MIKFFAIVPNCGNVASTDKSAIWNLYDFHNNKTMQVQQNYFIFYKKNYESVTKNFK